MTDQQNLKPGINEYNWGSHRPVLDTVFELLAPKKVLELGMGKGSSRYLYEHASQLVSVENNRSWFEEMCRALPPRQGFTPICHPLYTDASGTIPVRYNALPHEVPPFAIAQATAMYRSLIAEHKRFDLILVDQYASTREASLRELYQHADVLALHDAEHCSQPADHPHHDLYGYNQFYATTDLSAFHHLRFDALPVHTDVLIRRSLGIDIARFCDTLNAHTLRYRAGHPRAEGTPFTPRQSYVLPPTTQQHIITGVAA